MINTIRCPFCNDEPELDYIYTEGEDHQIDCEQCNRAYTYRITKVEFDESEDAYDECEDRRTINYYECEIDHWCLWKNLKYGNWLEQVDWLFFQLPLFIKRFYFLNSYGIALEYL